MFDAIDLPDLLIQLVKKRLLLFRDRTQIQEKCPRSVISCTAAVTILIQYPCCLLILLVINFRPSGMLGDKEFSSEKVVAFFKRLFSRKGVNHGE